MPTSVHRLPTAAATHHLESAEFAALLEQLSAEFAAGAEQHDRETPASRTGISSGCTNSDYWP